MNSRAQLMNSGEELLIRIRAVPTGEQSEGHVRLQKWNKKDRAARAARGWVTCWILAILSVFIPVLHFFLVPALLFAGPVVAFFVVGQESVILGGEGTCPDCKANMPIPRQSDHFPISDVCPNCQVELRLDAHFAP